MTTAPETNLHIQWNDIKHKLAGPYSPAWGRYNDQDVTLRLVQLSGNASVNSKTVADEVTEITQKMRRTLKLDESYNVKYSVVGNEVYFVREGKPLVAYLQQFSDKERQHQMWPKIREIAAALMDLHEHDMVHGNLESSSVLVCGDQAKLDVMMPVPMATMVEFKTSPEWRAPELNSSNQERKRLPTKASDIFALGLFIIHAVTGTLPLINRPGSAIVLLESISDRMQRQLLCDMCNRYPTSRPSVQEVVRRITRFCDCQYLLELTRKPLHSDDLSGQLVSRLEKLQGCFINSPKCAELLAAVVDFVSSPVIDPEASSTKIAITFSQFHHRLDCLMKESESSKLWLKGLRKKHQALDDATISAISLIPWEYRHLFLSGAFTGSPTTKHTYDNRDVVIHVLPHPSECSWSSYERWEQLRHPNVVEFIGFCKAPKPSHVSISEPEPSPGKPLVTCGVVSEAFDGKPLIEHVRETDDIEADDIRELLRQAAAGLAKLHAHNLVHGRINATCFLYANGNIKLSADRVSPAKVITTTDTSDSMADDVIRFGILMGVILHIFTIENGYLKDDEQVVISSIKDLAQRARDRNSSKRPTMEELVDCLSLSDASRSNTAKYTSDFEVKTLDHAVADRISILQKCITSLDDDELIQRLKAMQRRYAQYCNAKENVVSSFLSTDSAHPVDSGLIRVRTLFFVQSSQQLLIRILKDLDLLASLAQQVVKNRERDELHFEWESINLVTHCDSLIDEISKVIVAVDTSNAVRLEIAAWCCYEYNRDPNQFTTDQQERLCKMHAQVHEGVDMKSVRLPDWFVPSYQVEIFGSEELGSGSFGKVCRAQWQGSTVAAKLAIEKNENEGIAAMIREADTWFPIRHPRVSRMLGGFHYSKRFLLSEYEKHGSLKTYLTNKVAEPSDVKIAKWRLLYEAALGLQYLHDRGIAHGDLRGDNILVGSDGRAKIGDMGLSFKTAAEGQHRVALGAWAWKAPEMHEEYTGELPDGHSLMSDVYALAMCIIEAFTDCAPYAQGNRPLCDAAVRYYLNHNKPPAIPRVFIDKEFDLVKDMCNFSPSKRLKIHQVTQRLEGFAYPHNAPVAASG